MRENGGADRSPGTKTRFFRAVASDHVSFNDVCFLLHKTPAFSCNDRISHKIRMATSGATIRSRLGGKLVFGDVVIQLNNLDPDG